MLKPDLVIRALLWTKYTLCYSVYGDATHGAQISVPCGVASLVLFPSLGLYLLPVEARGCGGRQKGEK